MRRGDPMTGVLGVVYLIHFDRPYKHAKHYTGWALDLDARIAQHRGGYGSRLLSVIKDEGIGWSVARTWAGVDRNYERSLKRRGGASRCCPMCGVKPRR